MYSDTFVDLYTILNVEVAASQDAIKSAFRKLAQIYHPDKNPGSAKAEATFITIHNAYTVLSDPEKRREYDLFLKQCPTPAYQGHSDRKQITSTDNYHPLSLPEVISHLNFALWEIEDFLLHDFKRNGFTGVYGRHIEEILIEILTFIDTWVLNPAGLTDYFMSSRNRDQISPTVYGRQILSKSSNHKPYYSISNYFYDIRKRADKLFNTMTYHDLLAYIPHEEIRLIDAIMEAQNLAIYYLTAIRCPDTGNTNSIEQFKFSYSCFKNRR